MTNKQIEKIQGAILTCFTALYYLEETKRLNVFRHSAKKHLKNTINDLQEIETKYFNEIDKIDDNELGDKLIANQITFVNWLLKKFSYHEFTKIQEILLAYETDPKRITGISDRILKDLQKS